MYNLDWNLVIGIGGIVIGVIVSIYFYLKSREAKEPQCYYKTFKNIEKLTQDEKLKVYFDNKEVERVCTTYVFFWNKGKRPIKKEDIPEDLVFMLNGKDSQLKILDYKIINISRRAINFTASQIDRRDFAIDFDFLDKNDGAVIEIKHSGDTDTDLSLSGVILGIPTGIKCRKITHINLYREPIKLKKISKNIFPPALFMSFIIFAYLRITGEYNKLRLPTFWDLLFLFLFITLFFSLLYTIPAVINYYLTEIPKYPKSLDIKVEIKPS